MIGNGLKELPYGGAILYANNNGRKCPGEWTMIYYTAVCRTEEMNVTF